MRCFVGCVVVAFLQLGAATAVPFRSSEAQMLQNAIESVERKNVDLAQQLDSASARANAYNLTVVQIKTDAVYKELASLKEEEKAVRKQFGLEKKGCCASTVAFNHKLPKEELAESAQYPTRLSLENKLVALKNLNFMAQSDKSAFNEDVASLTEALRKKAVMLNALKQKAIHLGAELESKDKTFDLATEDPETKKDKDKSEPQAIFRVDKATPVTVAEQEDFQSKRRDITGPKSSTQ